jgi:hypothetical protein
MKTLGLSIILVLPLSSAWAFDYGTYALESLEVAQEKQEQEQEQELETEFTFTIIFDSVTPDSSAKTKESEETETRLHVTEITGTFQD